MKKIKLLLLIIITSGLLLISSGKPKISAKEFNGLNLNNQNTSFVQELKDIPAVPGYFVEADNPEKVGQVTFIEANGGHNIIVKHPNGTNYVLASSSGNPTTVVLPNVNDYPGSLILNSGKFFKGQNGEKLLYYEFQKNASSKKLDQSIFEDNNIEINGIRPYVIWNVETGEYDATAKMTMYAAHYAGSNRRAFVDVVLPIDIDMLLSIELNWEYRYQMAGGLFGYTNWRYGHTVRYANEKLNATSFWNEFKNLLALDHVFKPSFWNFERFSQQTITDLGNVTNDYKSDYVNKINNKLRKEKKDLVTIEDIFNGIHGYSVQRIYLDTYDAGLYTGYQIADNIELIDIMYIYQGEYFHPVINDIDWIPVGGNTPGVNLPNVGGTFIDKIMAFLNWLTGKFSMLGYIIFGGVILIIVSSVVIVIKWIYRKLLR